MQFFVLHTKQKNYVSVLSTKQSVLLYINHSPNSLSLLSSTHVSTTIPSSILI